MNRQHAPNTQGVPSELAGQWTAWNREQTRIVGSGHTFDEAKSAAAAAGERSVVLAKVPNHLPSHGGWRWTFVVAVFIAMTAGISSLSGSTGAASGASVLESLANAECDDTPERD